MSKIKYPTQKDLNQKWWFRMGQIAKYIIIILSLLSPTITGGLWYFDGVLNAFLWYLILKVIWLCVKYIAYGKTPNTKEINEEKKRSVEIFAFILVITGLYLLIAYAALSS